MNNDDRSSQLERWVERGTPLGATLLLERVGEQLAHPVTSIQEPRTHPAQGSSWRNVRVAALAAVLVLVVVGGWALLVRGGGDTVPVATQPPSPSTSLAPVTTVPPPETTRTPTTTVASTTTEAVVVDRLGLRVPLGAPEQTRAEFLAGLDAEGWVTYTDDVVGWSIRYPTDWTVGEATEPGRTLLLVAPSGETGLVVTLGLDAAPADASSYDYHVRYIEAAVAAGILSPPLDDQWLDDYWVPLDVDFDGRFDPQDITAVELYRTVDNEGNPIPDGHPSAAFQSYAYYDPAAEPAYAYWFETYGDVVDHLGDRKLPSANSIVTSFEPPGGYPTEP